VVNYRPKDRMLSTPRGTYMVTGLVPVTDGQPEYRIKHQRGVWAGRIGERVVGGGALT
jgi:hypothetical protein